MSTRSSERLRDRKRGVGFRDSALSHIRVVFPPESPHQRRACFRAAEHGRCQREAQKGSDLGSEGWVSEIVPYLISGLSFRLKVLINEELAFAQLNMGDVNAKLRKAPISEARGGFPR